MSTSISLVKFNKDSILAKVDVTLLVCANLIMVIVKVLVVNVSSPYKVILGRIWIH